VTSLKNDNKESMLAVDVSKYINIAETGHICEASYKPIKKNKFKNN
jgi:hypothetical protein